MAATAASTEGAWSRLIQLDPELVDEVVDDVAQVGQPEHRHL
jgi:hypothetical protein